MFGQALIRSCQDELSSLAYIPDEHLKIGYIIELDELTNISKSVAQGI